MPNAYNLDTAEDITGQAGWMFSDMLVALMVVFLATITFLPDYALGKGTGNGASSVSTPSASGNFIYVEHFDKYFTSIYQSSTGSIAKDVSAFLASNNLPTNAVIDSAQIVGGYNPKKEYASVGVARASDFAQRIDKLSPHLLEHASTILNSSPTISPGKVTVKLTFSSNVTTNR